MPTLGLATAPQITNVPKIGVGFASDPNFDWSDRVEMTKVRKEFASWGDWTTALSWDLVRGLSQYVDGKYSGGAGGNVYMIKNVLRNERYEPDIIQALPTSSPFPPTVSRDGATASTFTQVTHANGNRMIEEVRYDVIKGARLQNYYTSDELNELINLYMELIGNVLPTGVNVLDYIGVWRPSGVSTRDDKTAAEMDEWLANRNRGDGSGEGEPKKIPWILLAIAAKFLLF